MEISSRLNYLDGIPTTCDRVLAVEIKDHAWLFIIIFLIAREGLAIFLGKFF